MRPLCCRSQRVRPYLADVLLAALSTLHLTSSRRPHRHLQVRGATLEQPTERDSLAVLAAPRGPALDRFGASATGRPPSDGLFGGPSARFINATLGTRALRQRYRALHNGSCIPNSDGERVGCSADCSCGFGSRCYPRFVLIDDAEDRRWFNLGVCDVDMRLPFTLSLVLFGCFFFGILMCHRWKSPMRPKEYYLDDFEDVSFDIRAFLSTSSTTAADGGSALGATASGPSSGHLQRMGGTSCLRGAGVSGSNFPAPSADIEETIQRTMLEPVQWP